MHLNRMPEVCLAIEAVSPAVAHRQRCARCNARCVCAISISRSASWCRSFRIRTTALQIFFIGAACVCPVKYPSIVPSKKCRATTLAERSLYSKATFSPIHSGSPIAVFRNLSIGEYNAARSLGPSAGERQRLYDSICRMFRA